SLEQWRRSNRCSMAGRVRRVNIHVQGHEISLPREGPCECGYHLLQEWLLSLARFSNTQLLLTRFLPDSKSPEKCVRIVTRSAARRQRVEVLDVAPAQHHI